MTDTTTGSPAIPSDEEDLTRRIRAAEQSASGLRRPRTPLADRLRELADHADVLAATDPDAARWDFYGDDGVLAELERRTAEVLGTEDAAFFPSGIMAQQSALRVWSDRTGSRRIALPDLSHLVVHEEDGPRVVHGFEYVWLTEGPRTATAADVRDLTGEVGAVLVELPLRDGGYLLPEWDELVAVSEACRERGIPLHLDGARLWESADHLGRSLPDVAALADTVYVSFYKGLEGLSGAALAGPRDVVDEARIWRRRLGGTLWSLAPEALAALVGLENRHGMPAAHAGAVRLAEALQAEGLRTVPERPHANAFRVFLEGEPDALRRKAVDILEAGTAVPLRWSRADVPGWCFAELTVMPACADIDMAAYAKALAHLARP